MASDHTSPTCPCLTCMARAATQTEPGRDAAHASVWAAAARDAVRLTALVEAQRIGARAAAPEELQTGVIWRELAKRGHNFPVADADPGTGSGAPRSRVADQIGILLDSLPDDVDFLMDLTEAETGLDQLLAKVRAFTARLERAQALRAPPARKPSPLRHMPRQGPAGLMETRLGGITHLED